MKDIILAQVRAADPNVLIICITVMVALTLYLLLGPPAEKDKRISSSGKNAERFVWIKGMATGNPRYLVTQEQALEVAIKATKKSYLDAKKKNPDKDSIDQTALLEKIYTGSRIKTRYMAVPDFTPSLKHSDDEMFYPGNDTYLLPVQQRLEKYKEVAVPLVTRVCEQAIKNAGITVDSIHKLVVVSSTGFLGPSLDCELIKSLKLPRSTDRSLVGFMGCAAAMNGYRIAMDFVKAHPSTPDKPVHALMVCVEISSVHSTFKNVTNDCILHAIFADGAAACVLSCDPADVIPKGTLAIVDDHGWLMEGTEDGITLAINDDGISCTLAKNLPQYIAKNMGGFVDSFLTKNNLTRSAVDFWAIHPGGKRIIEEAQNGLSLSDDQASYSWEVLAQYGNMLSPSVMFVLEKIFKHHNADLAKGEKGFNLGLAFSFSPGVGAEGIMLRRVN